MSEPKKGDTGVTHMLFQHTNGHTDRLASKESD